MPCATVLHFTDFPSSSSQDVGSHLRLVACLVVVTVYGFKSPDPHQPVAYLEICGGHVIVEQFCVCFLFLSTGQDLVFWAEIPGSLNLSVSKTKWDGGGGGVHFLPFSSICPCILEEGDWYVMGILSW